MRGLLGHGWLWLLLFSVVLVVRWLADDPTALLVTNDSPEYLWMSEQNLLDGDVLRGYRTWGYPVFLKLVRLVSPDCAWVPALQLGLHVAGVLVLYAGLRAVGFPTLAAVLVCLPVLLADSVYDQHTTQYLMTDSLANSVLLTAVGVFFLLLARPAQAWRWLALTLLVFAAYQMRPAYQSLVAVVPVSGWLLRSYVPRPRAFVLGLVLISWAPLLAFCGVRYHATGNFALVSFTGTNLSGIAGNLLREDMVPALRPENRPLAQALLAGQARPGLRWHVFVHWRPPLPPGGSPADLNYDDLYEQWEEIMWGVAYQHGQATFGNDQVRIDQALLDGSLDILAQIPGVWVAVVAHGVARAVLYATAVRTASVVPLYLFAAALLVAALARLAAGWPRLPPGPSAARRDGELLQLIAVPAVVLFLGQTLLLVSVAMPYPRYVEPAAVLLPGVTMTAVYAVVSRLQFGVENRETASGAAKCH